MRVTQDYIPAMYLDRTTGKARLKLSGRVLILGPWGSPETLRKYDQAIKLWLAAGRVWNGWADPSTITIGEVRAKYLRWAETYYRKAERTTTTVDRLRAGLSLLDGAKLDRLPFKALGPKVLRRFQQYLMSPKDRRWSRTTINRYTDAVVQMAKWAVTEQLCQPSLPEALRAVPHVRKGQTAGPGKPAVRESPRVRMVAHDLVETAKPFMPPLVRAMVELQLLTAMRPLEVVHMRGDQIEQQDTSVWIYRPDGEGNKLDHLEDDTEEARTVYMGPKAIEVLRPFLPPDPAWHVFRFTPGKKSTRSEGEPAYDVASYRRAITRACDDAHPHPTLRRPNGMRDADWLRTLTAAQRAEIERWRKPFRFSPVQLRHAAATYIANSEQVHVAQAILGHKRIQTTLGYVHVTNQQAANAARQHG